MSDIDMSSNLQNVFVYVWAWFRDFIQILDHIIIFPHLSLLKIMIFFVCLDLIVTSVFVLYDVRIEGERAEDREIRNDYYRSGTVKNNAQARFYKSR